MSLTAAEEKFVKDQIIIADLEDQIQQKLNEKAAGVSIKEQELIDYKAQMDTDIQDLQSQIDNLK